MQAQKLVVFNDKDQWLRALIHTGKTPEGPGGFIRPWNSMNYTEAAQKAPRERGFARARGDRRACAGAQGFARQAVKHDQRRVVPSGRNLFLAALLSDDRRVHVAQLRHWRPRRVGKQPDERLRSSIARPFVDRQRP